MLEEYTRLQIQYKEMAEEATLKCDIDAYEQLASDFLIKMIEWAALVKERKRIVEEATSTITEKQKFYERTC